MIITLPRIADKITILTDYPNESVKYIFTPNKFEINFILPNKDVLKFFENTNYSYIVDKTNSTVTIHFTTLSEIGKAYVYNLLDKQEFFSN